ncbi:MULTISPECIES: ThiF family adenylyltransferase [Paraburkholderia]|uniref:ThiF family adenylyltransferase n=1 Tax=Paraburkholderia TaxID=1822464 RepID=UPI0038B8B5C4
MSSLDAESMHRLAKMALDAGEVASPEQALELFADYRLRLHVGDGWADTLAGQACFLTALNTAARAFLGGVEVHGDLNVMLQVPLYEGREAHEVVEELGGKVSKNAITSLPTVVLGAAPAAPLPGFCIRLSWDHWRASVTPVMTSASLICKNDNPLAGVAAAAIGVNEAFLHIRGDLLDAGHRTVGLSLWNPLAVTDWHEDVLRGPALQYLPKALWLVGLGHLGQAYAWTMGMLPYRVDGRPHLVLQDFDKSTKSNLSTCMLLSSADIGKRKVRHVGKRLEAAGFTIDLVERRFGPHHHVMPNEPTTVLFGVDNVAARRDLDSAGFAMVVEAGLGSGYRDFRNIRTHTFPGPRKPSEIWTSGAGAQVAVELNDTYKKLARKGNDLCGMTQLASRAVATPFVGAMAAALVLSEVIRPLHGGPVHPTIDLQLKNLRYRTGSPPSKYVGLPTSYVQALSPKSAASKPQQSDPQSYGATATLSWS